MLLKRKSQTLGRANKERISAQLAQMEEKVAGLLYVHITRTSKGS